MMLSVILERVGMGFLEGTGTDASPERIVSLALPGFRWGGLSGSRGPGGRGQQCQRPCIPAEQVAANLSLGNIFMDRNRNYVTFRYVTLKAQECDGEGSGRPGVPSADLCHQGTAFLGSQGGLRSWVAAAALLFSGLRPQGAPGEGG